MLARNRKSCEGSIKRVRKTTRVCCAASNPGARKRTKWGAKISPKTIKSEENQGHAGDDRGVYVPAFFLVLFRHVLRKDGNEKHPERASGNEVTKEIGEGERRVVRIGDAA